MKSIAYGVLIVACVLAAFWLKFFAQGWLRGNLYDLFLVALVSSATFHVRNRALIKSAGSEPAVPVSRSRQIALNTKCSVIWTLIACAAEFLQGLATWATGKPVLGFFDPIDLACYVAGGVLSFNLNPLSYVDEQVH